MSANPTARLYETTPARLLNLVEHPAGAALESSTVADDLADGIEAVHQIANLAGYSERPRAFVLALASAAHKRGVVSVELFDEELADLQNCSVKTVRRQRADYLRESRRPGTVDLVGVEEGEFDRENSRHAPTRYTLHLSGTVEAVVADARRDPRWNELDRKAQRDLLKRAAASVYDCIPDAARRARKRKKPRLATAEVETHWKAASTHLRKLRQIASKLPAADREHLFTDPGEMRARWLQLRAEMDALCGVNSPQPAEPVGNGQLVHHPPGEEEVVPEPTLEDVAAWDRMTSRLSHSPGIRTVEVNLRPPERPPGELSYEPDVDAELEAEAVRAEGCGEL